MIKRTITTFETVASKVYKKKGELCEDIIAVFTWQGGTRPNDGAARKAYALQNGARLPKGLELEHTAKTCEVWGMDNDTFMKYARKLNEKEIAESEDEDEE